MMRRIATMLVIAAVGLGIGCAKGEPDDPVEAAYKAMRAEYTATDDEAKKAELAEQYLAEFPDTAHSGSMAAVVAYYRGDRLGDQRKVFDVLSAALDRIEDPEARFEVSMAMVPASYEVGRPVDLAAVAGALAAERTLGFEEHYQVMEAAEQHDLWSLAERHADAALAFATEEAYRSDYPDREFSDDQVALRARLRKVQALAYKGWALCNQGRDQECFSLFEEADPLNATSYAGSSETSLNLFWGQALADRGAHEQAMELLLPDALLGDRTNALPPLKEAYVALHGDDEGFEEYLWSERQRMARTIDDFTLPDYDGQPHSLSDRNGKVMLLAFWFPT
jgi:hypothetical protein